MTGNQPEDTADQALLAFLAAQRDAVAERDDIGMTPLAGNVARQLSGV